MEQCNSQIPSSPKVVIILGSTVQAPIVLYRLVIPGYTTGVGYSPSPLSTLAIKLKGNPEPLIQLRIKKLELSILIVELVM